MAFWTYMLKCSDGRYYTGHTDNLDHRIGQHQCGQGSEFTKFRLPVTLAWSEAFGTRIEALEAERIVGGWLRAKKEALIAGNRSLLSHLAHLARPPKERTNNQAPFVSSAVEKRGSAEFSEANGERGASRFSTSLETNGPGVANPDHRP